MSTLEWVVVIELAVIAGSAAFSVINTFTHWGDKRYPCDGIRHKYEKKLPKQGA